MKQTPIPPLTNTLQVDRPAKKFAGTRSRDKQMKISAKKYNRKIKTMHERRYS